VESRELGQKLLTAAQRYCLDRIHYWTGKYSELEAQGRTRTRSGGTEEAVNVYPRYNLLGSILNEIECFVGSEFESLGYARDLLRLAGGTDEHGATGLSAIAAAAEAEERAAYRRFVAEVSEDQLREVAELPYRRRLAEEEQRKLFHRFVDVWGNWYGGSVDGKNLPANVTLHVAAMDAPEAYEKLRQILRDRGIERIFELREGGCGREIARPIAEFLYTGAEGFWTAGEMDWMVYASHESSITFGGEWLIEAMRKAIPEFERWIYKGWDESQY
jgi:hypothetical protein